MTTLCPDPGQLRAWLDRTGPLAGGAPPATDLASHPLADHLARCETCQAMLAVLERVADDTARVLNGRVGPAPTAAETEVALTRLHGRLTRSPGQALSPEDALSPEEALTTLPWGRYAAPPSLAPSGAAPTSSAPTAPPPSAPPRRDGEGSTPMPRPLDWRRWRLALGGLAAALTLAVALATPEGQAIAAGFLAQFRSQRLTIVTFDPNQTRQTGLFRFEQLGTVKNNQPPRPVDVASVHEAASRAGFPVLQPDPATLPAGAARTPRVRFSPASETRLTFDKQKSRAYFDSINRKDLALPDKMDGATLVVALPPVVMLEYATADNKPAVMVGEAREVQVGVEGAASLDEVRAFLLGLPDVPPDLARQLRSIQDWTSTLPIPVPVDKMTWQETTIAGAPAYILNDNTGLGSGVIWQRDGRIVGVAGPMKANELRRIAESLK